MFSRLRKAIITTTSGFTQRDVNQRTPLSCVELACERMIVFTKAFGIKAKEKPYLRNVL